MKFKSHILIILLATIAFSQSIKLSVAPSTKKLGLNDQLTLYLTLESSTGDNVRVPKLPNSINNDWQVLNSSSSTSTNFNFGGGKSQSSKTQKITYYLKAKRKGKLTIPAVSLTHKNKQYSSKAFQVEVVDGSVAPQQSQSSRRGTRRTTQQQQPAQVNSDDIFLKITTDKKTAYVGEPIKVTYTLYSKVNIVQLGMSKEATYPGFWAEDFYNISQLNWKNETLNGQRYRTAVIKKLILYPGSSGKQKTTPLELTVAVQLPSRSFFDFFGNSKQVNVKSKALTIDVKALPTSGKPSDFSGAVGSFNVSLEADQTQCAANNAISVKIIATGTGNVKSLDKINANFPQSFEIYGENEDEKMVNKTKGIRQKSFEYVVIPREKGTFEINPVSIVYFDPQAKTYKRASSKPLTLNISQGDNGYPQGGITMLQKDDVISVGKDINFIKTKIPKKFYTLTSPNYWFLFILLPAQMFIIVLAIYIRKNRLKLFNDSSYARFVNAFNKAQTRIKKIGPENEKSLSEIAEALEVFITDKLDVEIGQLNPSETKDKLLKAKVDVKIADELISLQTNLDLARFAPGANAISTQEAATQALKLMKSIEGVVKR